MKLALGLGYWSAGPPAGSVEQIATAERLGFDSIWTAEAYGSDALTPLAWWGAATETIGLGTSICQISARTPAAMAMAAMSIDHLSGGRFRLGLGVSGPQVVEGWYGESYPRPLARTREYVEIIRKIWAREEPVEYSGDFYQLPHPGGAGLGKPLKSTVHPLRSDIPIYLGAEGPKNVALAAEIADGWLPLFYNPYDESVYAQSLVHARPDFEIAQMVQVKFTDDIAAGLLEFKYFLSFYVGGMGAKSENFHKNLFIRMGYEAEAEKIQQLFMEDKRDEAARVIPDELADAMCLVGPKDRVRERLQAWRDSRVTTLLVTAAETSDLQAIAELW